MKKIFITATALLLIVSGASAQTIYDAAKFTDRDLNGTARFVGMGGAMGALGGDITTIGTNPAGIGIYRSNDIMTTFGISTYGTETNYMGVKSIDDKNNKGTFDNLGIVLSTKIGNYTPLRYVNFGFNYKRAASFYNNTVMEGELNRGPNGQIVSQTYQMANQAFGLNPGFASDDAAFTNNGVGWLTAFGYQGFVINPTGWVETSPNNWTKIAPSSDPKAPKPGSYSSILEENGYQISPYARYRSEERGGIDQYDFNIAFNFNDRIYLGFTVGAYDVDYRKKTIYDEDFDQGEGYTLTTNNNISGPGFDFKMGAIFRPFEYSPFRIGLAIHTPTFYNLTSETDAFIESDIYSAADNQIISHYIDSYKAMGDRVYATEYRLRTPWKYNLSIGSTVGKAFAFGAEYEYQDYSSMKFEDVDYNEMQYETSTAKDYLKGVHTFRTGVEYKVIPEFAIRAGYNYMTSAFQKFAYKELPVNSVITDTDYTNMTSRQDFTFGVGYRGSMFYADLAYKYTLQKGDFFAFADPDNFLNKTELTNTRSQALLTLGLRF